MNIFLYSSPLQYLCAHLVIEKEKIQNSSIGVYYLYDKDFTHIFKMIDKVMGRTIQTKPLSSFHPKVINHLFLTNRFSSHEIQFYTKHHNIIDQVSLYEEGANMYLPHFFLDKTINDSNLLLKLKNTIKKKLGKQVSHLPLTTFDSIYSIFDIPFIAKKTKNILIYNEFKKLQTIQNKNNFCLILSQWFVEHRYLTENEYITYIKNLSHSLKKTYNIVYFKPHPRDNNSMVNRIYNIDHIARLPSDYEDLPAELVIAKLNLDVFGFWTSTMFYVIEAWDINVYSLFEDLLSNYKKQDIINMYELDAKILLNKHHIPQYISGEEHD